MQEEEWARAGRRQGRGGRKVFSGPAGDPPDVAQTPTFLTSNCGLTCSDRWWTCPQSTQPYTAMLQQVPQPAKYEMWTKHISNPPLPLTSTPAGIQAEIQSHCLHWSMFNSVEPGFMFLVLGSAREMILTMNGLTNDPYVLPFLVSNM